MVRIGRAHVIIVSILIVSVILFFGLSSDSDVDESSSVTSIIQDGGVTTSTATSTAATTAGGNHITNSISHLNKSANSASSLTSNASNTNDGAFSEGITITNGTTKFQTTASKISLPYLHCGHTFYVEGSFDPTTDVEIILLHGAAFTKQDWEDSGILKSLCTLGNRIADGEERKTSVTALDLSVKSTGEELYSAFHALYGHANVLSGKPAVVVSPSASGKAMVELAQYYHDDATQKANGGLLKKMVSAWVTVASPAVLKSTLQDSELKSYVKADVPVLAIHGDEDRMGGKVTKRLVDVVGAEGVELKGKHPCYLDSPDDFVKTVLDFVDRKFLGNGNEGK